MRLTDPVSANQVFVALLDFPIEWPGDGDIVLLYWLVVLSLDAKLQILDGADIIIVSCKGTSLLS